VTTDMHINFLRPAVGSDLFAEANLLRAGKSRIVGEVTVWVGDARDRPVAKVVGAYARLA
jgi:acyl-coenzyme A thioesterase PaaI-like protein